MEAAEGTFFERLRRPETHVAIAQNAAMDFSMLWKDLIGGSLSPASSARSCRTVRGRCSFCKAPRRPCSWLRTPSSGPLIASFVRMFDRQRSARGDSLDQRHFVRRRARRFCTPTLIVLPLLDIYRKYYGVRMMLYMFAIFFVTMAVSAMIMDGAFSVLHLVPTPNPNIVHDMTTFSFNYTFG